LSEATEDQIAASLRPRTMRDIAQEAGVAQSTVSRVLNNAPSSVAITPETRERVMAAAARLGYRPNPLARALRGAGTMLVGAIVRDITDPFFAKAVEALSVEANARGYNVVLGHARGKEDEALALAAILETRHCDAIILLGDMGDQPRLIEDLAGTPVPVVALWQGSRLRGIPAVNVDNALGIRLALDHLTSLGHRRIAFIGGRPLGDIEDRRLAFIDYLSQAGLPAPQGYMVRSANTFAGGDGALRSLMALPEPPTAVVAATDVRAIGVLHAAASARVAVPADLSVVGFDDIPLAAYANPALTTLSMPTTQMIAEAVRMAIDEARLPESERGTSVRVLLPKLVVRESSAAPRI
jgi:DNA-binding LacI/PurR family transcriptional regulator